MPVNLDKPHLWKTDVAKSVDMYNDWFMRFAPAAFRQTRVRVTGEVESALATTDFLRTMTPAMLRAHPGILPTLRMSTCPPIAVDRLIGLAGVSKNLVKCMEDAQKLPQRMPAALADAQLEKIAAIITRMADPDIFVWLENGQKPDQNLTHRAATIVADRLCGAVANPIIRNAQEQRQLAAIKAWLEARGYRPLSKDSPQRFDQMSPGTFSFRMNVPIQREGMPETVNIPIDVVIMPLDRPAGELPVFFEAKSAGDFTNTNKRRKEEATKMTQLRATYGKEVAFNLFLCGYFDSGYLGYEAAEGIDWVWEHRIDDLAKFGL